MNHSKPTYRDDSKDLEKANKDLVNKNLEKLKVVSPFEFAIATAIDPEYAKTMRPETLYERNVRREKEINQFASKIKLK